MAPAFLVFFSKRDTPKAIRKSSEPSLHSRPKSPARLPHASSNKSSLPSPSIADTSEQLDGSELSIEAEYVLADADSPTLTTSCVYPPASSSSNPSNAAGASTSTTKLKIPFRRKPSTPDKLTTTVTPQILVSPVLPSHEPHKFSMESSVSSLLPPPSRSTIFGSYADPHNALSTRSLPQDVPLIHSQMTRHPSQDYETMSNPDSHTTSPPAPQSKQPSKGGLFSWARPRGRTKSKASLPDPSLRSPPVLTLPPTDSFFDLKSFRHVTSPETSPSSSSPPPNKSPQPRPPRPRGDSFTSDPSQRISVAAFREAQARRSTTDSPVPSSSGDRDSFASSQVRNHKLASLLATPPSSGPTARPQARFPSSRSPPSRSSTAPLSFSMSMTSSESSEEEESESEEEATLRPTRKRTITSRSVHSELGRRSSPISTFSATRSDIGHGLSSGLTSRPPPTPRNARNSPGLEASGSGSSSPGVYSNARGSVSTSALMPDSTPANRVSGILKSPAVSRPMHPPQRSRSRASTSSESSSEYSDSDDAPLSSLIPPPRPGSATSRASGSPARCPAKPLIDIGQLVGENSALPPRPSEPSSDPSQLAAQTDSTAVRLRKTSLGLGERLSALASGLSGLQPSRSKSQDSLESKDEAFTPPEIPEKPPLSQSPVTSPLISPLPSPVSHPKPSPPPLKSKSRKPSSALRFQSSGTPKLNTSSLDLDSTIPPPSSSSTSSDAPIPHIKPTPIRAREEPPAFAVTSRPISHASNPSIGALTAVDKAVVAVGYKSGPSRSVPGTANKPKPEQQQQRWPPQEESHTTVRVVRSVPLKSVKEEPLPAPRPQSRPRLPSVAVTVSNVHLTPPSSSVSTSSSALRQAPGSGGVVPPRRPFAMRDSSPVSSAGDSSSSRMPITPRDGSDLGVGPTGRPGLGHRKRASVTFADELEDERGEREKERERRISVGSRLGHGHGPAAVAGSSDDEDSARDREREAEKKRKERRRGEAKAAIELGNVINGTGPIDDDDDEDEGQQPMNVPPRMSMAMGGGMGTNHTHDVPFPTVFPHMGLQGQWGASAAAPFGNQLGSLSMQNLLNAGVGPRLPGGMDAAAGVNMGAGMFDPRVFAVHQQAMMIAKQTYQLAVAQQAMRDAADEWERGSAISGWTGGGRSSVAAPSMLGMGMGMNMPMNMNMGGGGGGSGGNSMGGYPGLANSYLMPNSGGMWPGGAMPGFPGNASRSMYGYAASEFGGASSDRGGPGGWATSSVYGEAFGTPRDRSSRAFRQSQVIQAGSSGGGGSAPIPAQSNLKRDREGGRPRTRTAPSGMNPAAPRASSTGVKKKGEGYGLVGVVSPPSSWKG